MLRARRSIRSRYHEYFSLRPEPDIIVDGQVVEHVKLSDYRALASERNIHREGYIGKSYKYPDTFREGQAVKVVEKQTQIVIFEDVVS